MNGKIKKAAFVMLALALAACASPRGLTSQFLSNDPCTDQVMAGTPYNMDDPFLTLFWRNNCAYKVFSAFHMLGYQTQFFDAIGSAKPQLKSLHRFQSHHGLPITDMVTSDTIRILDSELTLREQKIAPIAKKFLLYDHMQPLHPNDISKDSLAMLFTLPMIVLPQYLQITTEYESVQCINGQCNGSIQDANGNPWPTHPIDITQDYRFVGTIYFDPNVCTNSWLPSAAVIVDTVLHEYAHYLDGTWSSPIAEQPHFGLINAMDFYNIGYYMSSYNNGCALPRSNNLKDWISYYGFVGSRDCASEHLDGYEVVQDWA